VVDGIPKLESSLARLEKSIRDENRTVERQRARLIDEYEPVVAEFESRVPPSLKSLEVVDAELTEQRAKRDGLKQEQAILELQLRETAELITRGVCPRCGQKISQDFTLRSSHLDGEFLRVKAEVAVLEEEVLRTAALSESIRSYREDKEAYEVAKRRVSDLNQEISEASKRLKEAEAESEGLRRDLHHAEAEVEKADELSARIARAETRLARAQHEKDEAVEALIHAVDRRDEGRRKIESLEVDINRKKDARERAKGLSGYVEWLSTFFTPTVLLIEKETMVQTNARFDHHFQRFFSALVDDPDLNVRVREDFSPVFERQGFDQDFDALSGGERTSVALAYRFALTTIAREDTGGQGELVILDEPTDGFSKEQVFKMRGLLEELKSRQVVLVSHERELEAMADSIFRVEKVNGTSKLTGT